MLCWCTLCCNKNVPFNFSCISRKSRVCFEGILMLSIESSAACMFVKMFGNKKLCVFSTRFICVFSGAFANLRKWLLVSSCLSVLLTVCPSVRMKQLGSHETDFLEIWYLNIFRIPVEKSQVSIKYYKKNGYITWRLIYIFIYRSIILRMRNTVWFKKMDSILYVYISWTLQDMWTICITLKRGGLKFENHCYSARALAYGTAVQQRQLRTKYLLCSTRFLLSWVH